LLTRTKVQILTPEEQDTEKALSDMSWEGEGGGEVEEGGEEERWGDGEEGKHAEQREQPREYEPAPASSVISSIFMLLKYLS